MVIRQSAKAEKERIAHIFESGRLLRKEAFKSLFQAIIMALLVIVGILTFATNLIIGIFTTVYGLLCYARFWLNWCLEALATPVVPKNGGIEL